MVLCVRGDIDGAAMQQAVPHLVGRYVATSWCSARADDRHAAVDVRDARLWEEDDLIVFEMTADRFVMHMVRIIIGTLMEVGRGRRTPQSIAGVITAQDREAAGPTAPPCGLCLEHVGYTD